jgi:hypothetical protein
MEPGKPQIHLGGAVDAALIFGNRFRGGQKIINEIGSKARIDLNAES